uniref:J domain-containing protein n=2 Tax=Steinernema glaseri TaxID=37863 RepID=A0A1I7ZZZ1_9BILA
MVVTFPRTALGALAKSHRMPLKVANVFSVLNVRLFGCKMVRVPGRYEYNCENLGVEVSATTNEIKDTYFTLAKKLHPNISGALGEIQHRSVYEAYNELMYWNTPLSFGNFPEASSNCQSSVNNSISIEEAFVEICIEYDALFREFRNFQEAFLGYFQLRHNQPHLFVHRDRRLLKDYREKFEDLHKALDEVHDVVVESQKYLSVHNNKCSLESFTRFTNAKRKFWNAQRAYMTLQKEVLDYLEQGSEMHQTLLSEELGVRR